MSSSSVHTYLQIEEVCQDGKLAHELGVPSKLTNYLAYIDLVLLRLTFPSIHLALHCSTLALLRSKSDSSSRRQWTVHKLEEYPARPDTPLQIDQEAMTLRYGDIAVIFDKDG